MAPYKFEENIKEKLEKRSLNPTDQGWEKLASRLDAQENKSKTQLYTWLSIAAVFLVLLTVGIKNFNSVNGKSDLPILVNAENEENNENAEPSQLTSNETEKVQLTEVIETRAKQNETLNDDKTSVDNNIELTTNFSNTSKAVAVNDKAVDDKFPENKAKVSLEPHLIENNLEMAKINEVVAELKKLQIENASVSEKEIDSLLKAAHRELLTDKINESKSMTVDADALLLEVEQDIESSFRSKVFEALKDSYNTIKTSVAERNN